MTSSLSISEFLKPPGKSLGAFLMSEQLQSPLSAPLQNLMTGWKAARNLSHAADLDYQTREEVADILRQLSRLELQARHNASLVSDMQNICIQIAPCVPMQLRRSRRRRRIRNTQLMWA